MTPIDRPINLLRDVLAVAPLDPAASVDMLILNLVALPGPELQLVEVGRVLSQSAAQRRADRGRAKRTVLSWVKPLVAALSRTPLRRVAMSFPQATNAQTLGAGRDGADKTVATAFAALSSDLLREIVASRIGGDSPMLRLRIIGGPEATCIVIGGRDDVSWTLDKSPAFLRWLNETAPWRAGISDFYLELQVPHLSNHQRLAISAS
jgi:hypothetical protein